MKKHTKIVHEGDFAAEVEIDLIYTEAGGRPICRLMMRKSWTKFALLCVMAI